MKTWMNADVVELNISATAQGGRDVENVDAYWTDNATGDLYASYASGSSDVDSGSFDASNHVPA